MSWKVALAPEAERDFAGILQWTEKQFGAAQTVRYRTLMISALAQLSSGPLVAGSRARDEVETGLRSLHVARSGKRGRHVLVYRWREHKITVLRILHDSMDIARHLTSSDEPE